MQEKARELQSSEKKDIGEQMSISSCLLASHIVEVSVATLCKTASEAAS